MRDRSRGAYRNLRSYSKMALRFGRGRASRVQRSRRRLIRENLVLPSLPPRPRQAGEVWGVTLMRNEADVGPQAILHMLEQGVDRVLAVDNGSTDGTYDALRELAVAHPVYVAQDRLSAFYQAEKVTLLGEVARHAGADWVVPFDADEFWFSHERSLADQLRSLRAAVARATIFNLFPLEPISAVDRSSVFRLDTTPSAQPKVAYRTHRMAAVGMGSHGVERAGERWTGLVVAHLPWRSREQLERKARQGTGALDAGDLSHEFSSHWRLIASSSVQAVDQMWSNVLSGRPDDRIEWSPVGPFLEAPVLSWRTWDTRHLLERRADG